MGLLSKEIIEATNLTEDEVKTQLINVMKGRDDYICIRYIFILRKSIITRECC